VRVQAAAAEEEEQAGRTCRSLESRLAAEKEALAAERLQHELKVAELRAAFDTQREGWRAETDAAQRRLDALQAAWSDERAQLKDALEAGRAAAQEAVAAAQRDAAAAKEGWMMERATLLAATEGERAAAASALQAQVSFPGDGCAAHIL